MENTIVGSLTAIPLALIVLFSVTAFLLSKKMVIAAARQQSVRSHSLPHFYGWCAAIWSIFPAILLYFFFKTTLATISAPILAIIIGASGIISLFFSTKILTPSFRARNHIEKWGHSLLFICAFISISITAMIVLSVLFESILFFKKVPIIDFLFGTTWSPQTALRADQAGSSGSFGAIPVFAGTLLITLIAMFVAAPLGLLSAIYLAEYAPAKTRSIIKPLLEILAGIPTVVYGYFAAITVAPFIRNLGENIGLDIASESALAAGLVIGIMIIPFILSLSDDVMNAVPNTLRDASYALGATKAETVKKVIIPAALPGIMGAVLLAISRAIGETMIVVMAAGLAANLTFNPLESVTTVTAQIVTLLVGDQEFDSAKTSAAFALGLTLFVVTLCLNILAMAIVKKYQEKYD